MLRLFPYVLSVSQLCKGNISQCDAINSIHSRWFTRIHIMLSELHVLYVVSDSAVLMLSSARYWAIYIVRHKCSASRLPSISCCWIVANLKTHCDPLTQNIFIDVAEDFKCTLDADPHRLKTVDQHEQKNIYTAMQDLHLIVVHRTQRYTL